MTIFRSLLLLLCLQPAVLAAAPRVVTSIAPLQEVSAALMHDIATPQAIIDGRESVHHFALKPSHMRLLQSADLVIWIDRHFEAGFGRIAQVLPPATRRLELMPALGIDDHDGHIWYSPTLLGRSIALIEAALVELDPANGAAYRANADDLGEALSDWHRRLRLRWQHSQPRFLTAHAFLGHFASDLPGFEIEHILDSHDSAGGLRDLQRLERWLALKPAACILTLEAPGALTSTLAKRYGLAIVAVENPAGGTILQRLAGLEAALERCLEATVKS